MKTCSKCGNERPLTDFSKKSGTRDGRQASCKPCARDYARGHYEGKTDYYRDKAKRSRSAIRSRNKQYVIDYLRDNPCVDCGETDLEVLQFDHVEMLKQRGGRVSEFYTGSLDRLIQEIERCEVRCANCHLRRTRKQMGFFR